MQKKITTTAEITVCDVCQKELVGLYNTFKCLNCASVYCLFHSSEYGISYPGTNLKGYIPNGFFCKNCDKKLILTDDSMHVFYRKMEQLADEFAEKISQLDRLRDEYLTLNLKN